METYVASRRRQQDALNPKNVLLWVLDIRKRVVIFSRRVGELGKGCLVTCECKLFHRLILSDSPRCYFSKIVKKRSNTFML